MKKCKNVECNKKTNGKNIYCSLSCRNYYVNKYIRDYHKNGRGLIQGAIDRYNLNPKICEKCLTVIPYKNRESKYCSRKCSKSCININRRGIKYEISNSGLNSLRKSACKNLLHINHGIFEKNKNKYDNNPKICPNCSGAITYTKRKNKFCSNKCNKNYKRKDIKAYLNYKQDTKFKFNLGDYPNEFDFNLINKYGWYAPSNSNKPNIGGVSRDHMLSVSEGFKLGIDAMLLAHPANCRLMIHSKNISKNKNSTLTKDELIDRINKWNIKYEKVTLVR